MGKPLVDKAIKWLRSNKISASIIIIGLVVIGLGSFTDAVKSIKEFFIVPHTRALVEPIIILPVEDTENKIATFRLGGSEPFIALRFIARKSLISFDFKASKGMKCQMLCNAIVNHFELMKSVKTNADIKIQPTLVVNSLYVPPGDQTLGQQGIVDGDVLQISYDYSGSSIASLNQFIWNDTLIQLSKGEQFWYKPTQDEIIISDQWAKMELFREQGLAFKKQNLRFGTEGFQAIEANFNQQQLEGKAIQKFGVF